MHFDLSTILAVFTRPATSEDVLTSYRSHCEDKNNDVPCGFNFPIHLRTTYYLMSSLILTNADAGLRLVRKNPLIPRTWRALERTHGRLPSGTEDTLYAMAGLGLVDIVGDEHTLPMPLRSIWPRRRRLSTACFTCETALTLATVYTALGLY